MTAPALRAFGRSTGTRRRAPSSASSTSSRSGSRVAGPARLPLRRLRADRAEAADERARTREDELDDLLRREVFVDLSQVVRQSLRISHQSYSIKRCGRSSWPAPARARSRVAAIDPGVRAWLRTGDRRHPRGDPAYNEEDCVSTVKLRDWLLERKARGGAPSASRVPWKRAPRRSLKRVQTRTRATAEGAKRSHARSARPGPCSAHLLDYHRREAKPGMVGLLRPAEEVAG